MEVTEIVLLVAGGVIFILSFLIPDRKDKKHSGTVAEPIAKEEIKTLVGQELEAVKDHVDDVVEEAITYAMEKTERSLERLSNEKIMAINEYSDTVMAEIHKNHEEAMFLYDMLNSKHANLKDTVSKVTQTVKAAEKTVNTFQKLAPEPVVPAPVNVSKSNDGKKSPLSDATKAAPAHPTPKAAFVRAAEDQMANKAAVYTPPRIDAQKSPPIQGQKPRQSNSNERILQLYQKGLDQVAIAKKLGLGVGEVKFVIDLFNSGNQGK